MAIFDFLIIKRKILKRMKNHITYIFIKAVNIILFELKIHFIYLILF